MSQRFILLLSLGLGVLFTLFAVISFTYQEAVATGFAAIIATVSFIFALRIFMITKGISLLLPNLIKNKNNESLIPASVEQGSAQNLNTLALSPDEEKFINHYSLGALMGQLYFFQSGMPKEAFKNYIPLYNITHIIKYFFEGRKMVWENVKWDSFETYKKRQILTDRIAIGYITFIFIAIILLLILRNL